jgi:hypothetical protein
MTTTVDAPLMPESKVRWLSVMVLVMLILPGFASTASYAQAGSRYFPETGKTVRGRFLEYWTQHGGLAQQGYPISDEMQERSDTDGKTYTVQYFERAVFEYHPENRPPNDVLLSLLGVFLYKQKYPNGAPGQTPNTSPGSVLFPQTGKRLGGVFLEYWRTHGGLMQQGYPISDEFKELSPVDGKTYTVQYFERAVFEYHPENRPPFDVLLSLLGSFRYQARYGAVGGQVAPTQTPVASTLSADQRLNLLDAVWTTVRDNYVYTDFRGLNWSAIYDEYRPKVLAARNDDEVYNLLAEMIDRLGDKHSSFLNPQQAAEDDALRRGDLKLSGIGVLSQEIDGAVRRTAPGCGRSILSAR